jgi:hypothetical protein
VLIGIGGFFLLSTVVPDIGRWLLLLIGLIFLVAFVVRREYGFLVAGCIVSGVGIGVGLTSIVDDEWAGAVVLLSIAGGFIAIWLISVLIHAGAREWPDGDSKDVQQALWWPLIPGGILSLIGLVVLAEEGVGTDLLRWWPVLLIGAGAVVLLASLRRRGRDQAPEAPRGRRA